MAYRRRRSNPAMKASEAAALRALLARHGYRVNARPNENQIETVRIKKRNPKKKRKYSWRKRWSSRAEMVKYMAKLRRKAKKAIKAQASKKRTKKRKTAKRRTVKRRVVRRKTAKRRVTRRKTYKRRSRR